MLRIIIPSVETFNEETNGFDKTKETELQLEHSLISVSKWESKWCKPFISKQPRTEEETIDYIRCMTITQNVDQIIYDILPQEQLDKIVAYIDSPMTATTFTKSKGKINNEIITSEIIYYWMVTFQINWEAQRWHLNRLLTLINICNVKNQPKGKRSKKDILNHNRELNAQRRAQLNTTG